jgi:hypothetical protein
MSGHDRKQKQAGRVGQTARTAPVAHGVQAVRVTQVVQAARVVQVVQAAPGIRVGAAALIGVVGDDRREAKAAFPPLVTD